VASKSEASKSDDPVDPNQPRLFEAWRAEVGDEEIARIVQAVRDDAAAGALPAFTDKEALLAYWNGRRPARRELADPDWPSLG
jgi:hypothetical protein